MFDKHLDFKSSSISVVKTSEIRFRTALHFCLLSFKKEFSVGSAKQLCFRIPSKIPESNKTDKLTTVSPILVAETLVPLIFYYSKRNVLYWKITFFETESQVVKAGLLATIICVNLIFGKDN